MSPNAPTDVPTPELLLDVRTPAELAFSPDETRLAFALHATVADEGSFPPSDLYLIDTDGHHPPVQLTSGPWSDRTPAWSPDGSQLAFLSDRITPGHQLPYTMATIGTDGAAVAPRLAATLTGSAESIAWASDGGRLLVLAADPGSYGLDWSARAVIGATPLPDPTTRRPGDARRRLFLVDLATSRAEEVGPEDRSVWEFDWDGDDTVVGLVSEDHSGSGWYQSVVARLNLDTRTAETLYEPTWQTGSLSLSLDATRAIVVEGYASDHGLLAGSVVVTDLIARTTTDPWPDLQAVGLASWCDEDSLWYGRTDGTGTACGRLHLDGRHTEPWRDDAFIGDAVTTPACAVSADGTHVWTTHQAHALPPELARFDHTRATWERLTAFNDHIVEGRIFPDSRTISWTGEDGTEIEGILMTPRGPTGPLPTIVCVHGGPTWNWGAYFSDSEPNAVLLASAGYACLLPNPRGSIGRGHAFAQDVIGDGGGIDFRDIMAGVDHCIAEGITDPDRLGIAGLSYGGYMAGWAVGQTDRFRAAVAMSVVSNYLSFHLTSEVWWYDQAILRGEWYDPDSQYLERSPVTYAHRSSTPTLILQGAEDRCTPVGQAEELFHALASSGSEVELVVYPREGHVPMERAHALDAIVRTQAWFDEHLVSART
ncbi:MAG: peptidase prolyl oligopeptidase active site domain protein [Actinomycetia bacterium]|jgi:dipeptidyl aminopeptidase/acylaminoacyl peptidase|nr:peptidase prolyl oligopeptidase active site domain protein [Actinomycetes bacterium]